MYFISFIEFKELQPIKIIQNFIPNFKADDAVDGASEVFEDLDEFSFQIIMLVLGCIFSIILSFLFLIPKARNFVTT